MKFSAHFVFISYFNTSIELWILSTILIMLVHGYQWKWDFVKGGFLFVSKNREDVQNFTIGQETERMSELSWSLSLTVLPNFKGPFHLLKDAEGWPAEQYQMTD